MATGDINPSRRDIWKGELFSDDDEKNINVIVFYKKM